MRHYLYRHIRPDVNVPFYIGIGTKFSKFRSHKQEYRRAYITSGRGGQRSKYWVNIYNLNNKKIEVEIMYESDSWEDIKDKEKEFIQAYGRHDKNSGTLANLTDGGDGSLGNIRSTETRQKISKASKGNKYSVGRIPSEDTRKRMSESRIGRIVTDATRKKISVANKGRKLPPITDSTREKLRIANTGRKLTDEAKDKISNSKKGKKIGKRKPMSEAARKKLSDINKGKKHSDATKLKISLAQMGRKNPKSKEFREKLKNSLKGNKNCLGRKLSIETKGKISLSLKKWYGRKLIQ